MRTTTKRTLRWGLAVLLSLGGLGGSAAPGATLRWKFKEGDALHYEMVQKTTTTLKAPNLPGQEQEKAKDDTQKQEKAKPAELKTTVTQTIEMTWTVKAVNPDGSARMSQTIDRIRTKSQSPTGLGNYEFDSKDGKEGEGPVGQTMSKFLKALVGSEFGFTMSPQGELSEVKVPQSVVEALKEAGPAGAGAAGTFSEEGLKNMITQSSLALPKDDLSKGTSWTRQAKIPSPPVGTMTLDKTYRYEGATEGIGEIALTFKVGFDEVPDAGLKLEIVKQDNTGSFTFDQSAGRIVSSLVSENLEMKLTGLGQSLSQSIQAMVTMKLVKPSK